ncbi:polysaccharide pyruvyl transferase family protein [Alteraurantiacibacter aquimixticola]|uniref:polysaccharide pyruvyl transferase family protein n=1 Tax=Alteraurantiacibacter aquimixticola TaxID=2489173 RepID=UPI001FE45598|nr:polysaccharide pyruvyl transferase family protein [Alteraurantiacibacter aquimixticola]
MELFYYRGTKPNFGDDLNELVWPAILSSGVFEIDDLVIVGIGSILSEEWIGKFEGSGKTVVILGAGTSYDLPPKAVSKWLVKAVRGPLTAKVIGMPEAAITDGAILLAAKPGLLPDRSDGGDVVFMPHHRSIRSARWEHIADRAGMRFVSPQQPVDDVLQAFAGAKLVVTEAMHGAIVADTMRIPWVPVMISPAFDEFKWRDWTSSMEVPLRPATISAGHGTDEWVYARMQTILSRHGIVPERTLNEAIAQDALVEYLKKRFDPSLKRALLQCRPSRARRVFAKLLFPARRLAESRAIADLKKVAVGPTFLSDPKVFAAKLQAMKEAVAEVEDLVRNARVDSGKRIASK